MIQNLYKTDDGKLFGNANVAFDYEAKRLGRDLIRMYNDEGFEVDFVKHASQFLVRGREAFNLLDWKRKLEGWNGIFGDHGYNDSTPVCGYIMFDAYENSVNFTSAEEIFDEGIEFDGSVQTAIYDEGWLN